MKDCYFYLEKEMFNAVCTKKECLEKSKDKQMFFWNGSVLGYGEYDLNCEICGDFINKLKEDNKEELIDDFKD